MYYAKQIVDVCFAIEEERNHCDLKHIAESFLKEESRSHVPEHFMIKEVLSLTDIPKNWWQATHYGDNPHDGTPADFLQDPEYKEFLRLKAKFEGNE